MGQFERESADLTVQAAMAANEALGEAQELTVVNNKPPAWVMLNGRDGEQGIHAPSVAVRISVSQDPEALLQETMEVADLTESVRRLGGRVLEILEPPKLLRGKFVAVISRYLPGANVTPYDYGRSMATMHNASVQAGLSYANRPFDPLKSTREAYQYLAEQQSSGRPLTIGQTVFPKGLLDELGERLGTQEAAIPQILGLMAMLSLKPALLQEDVHPGNVRYSKDGVATLIDLDQPSIGPGEADLGRVRTQWTKRFGAPAEREQDFLSAYAHEIRQQSDPTIVALTDQIMLLRYGSALVDLAVRQVQLGAPASEWLLQEGIRRLEHLDDPSYRWQPLNQDRKNQIADEVSS